MSKLRAGEWEMWKEVGASARVTAAALAIWCDPGLKAAIQDSGRERLCSRP
jgi:hypothetical protein